MSKQLVHMGIQQIKDLCLRIVAPRNLFYQIYTGGSKRDTTPHCKNAEKFIKDLKGA